MNRNQNTASTKENEIDLKDLFIVLWRSKRIIICITIIVTLLSGIYSFFILPSVYKSDLNIVISMPENLVSHFGEYKLPLSSNQQYIELITGNDVLNKTIKDMGYNTSKVSVEDLRSSISISTVGASENVVQNNFIVTVSAETPKEAKQLADILFANYAEHLDVMTKERAVRYYDELFSVQIRTLQNSVRYDMDLLEKNEELLKNTPQVIDQKAAIDTMGNTLNMRDFIILEDVINPNYTKVEGDIILLKQEIYKDENSILNYKEYLNELNVEKETIAKYYETGNKKILETSSISLIDSCIYLTSSPVEPAKRSSPSNARNVAIGAFLGGVISVLIVILKEYWT